MAEDEFEPILTMIDYPGDLPTDNGTSPIPPNTTIGLDPSKVTKSKTWLIVLAVLVIIGIVWYSKKYKKR